LIRINSPYRSASFLNNLPRMRALLLFLVLAACGRPLTPAERLFASEIQGDALDPAPIRIIENGFVGVVRKTYATRPRTTCSERILPPSTGPTYTTRTAGVVAFQHLHTNPDWTTDDYLRGYPARLNLTAAMFFAHEMTHIWQWQNRALTGYHPLKAASEQVNSDDPYLFDPESDTPLLDLGYEQQAAIVEEYVCCRTVAPQAARTERLYQLISAVMPVARITPTPGQLVRLPDPDADLHGICD
jgi:hypothetical protein